MLPKQPNQSLIDGLACLQALAGQAASVGVRELARTLDLEPTRVHRLLGTLAHLGLAEQTPDRRYRPGPGIHVLAAQSLYGSGLLHRALPILESLGRFKLVVALGVLWRDQVAYLYHCPPGTNPVEAIGRVGLYPASRSSLGMVLLTKQTESQVRQLYRGREIPGFASVATLLTALSRSRQQGYADLILGPAERTLAVSVDETAAIALAGAIPGSRIPSLVRALLLAARQIQEKGPNPHN